MIKVIVGFGVVIILAVGIIYCMVQAWNKEKP